MKIFDIIGLLVVAIWLGIAGSYIYRAETGSSAHGPQHSAQFVMDPGETWLVLRRQDKDAGYLHQTRTRLADGWLFEYDIYVALELLGELQIVETSVKSRLDADGYLQKFTARASAGDDKFWAEGSVEGLQLKTRVKRGEKTREETVPLQQPPRLAASALHVLLADKNLEPGAQHTRRYFDPLTLQMKETVVRYEGKDTVEVYDEHFPAERFTEVTPGGRLDIYADTRGEVLIRGFPLKIVGARVPAALGRTRSASIRRQVDARRQKLADDAAGAAAPPAAFGLEQTLRMLSGQTPADANADADADTTP